MDSMSDTTMPSQDGSFATFFIAWPASRRLVFVIAVYVLDVRQVMTPKLPVERALGPKIQNHHAATGRVPAE